MLILAKGDCSAAEVAFAQWSGTDCHDTFPVTTIVTIVVGHCLAGAYKSRAFTGYHSFIERLLLRKAFDIESKSLCK